MSTRNSLWEQFYTYENCLETAVWPLGMLVLWDVVVLFLHGTNAKKLTQFSNNFSKTEDFRNRWFFFILTSELPFSSWTENILAVRCFFFTKMNNYAISVLSPCGKRFKKTLAIHRILEATTFFNEIRNKIEWISTISTRYIIFRVYPTFDWGTDAENKLK